MAEVLPVPWPTEMAQKYRDLGYWRGMELTSSVRRQASTNPEKAAVVDDAGRTLSYADLDDSADRVAGALLDWGLRPGDRFVLQLPNTIELIELFLGSIRASIVPVMVLPTHREQEVAHLANLSEAVAYAIPEVENGYDYRLLAQAVCKEAAALKKVLVVGSPCSSLDATSYQELMENARRPSILPPSDPSSVAVYLHSGGTSGLPKLIPRTHDDYAYNSRGSAEVCNLNASSVYLASLSVAHNFPLACPGVLGTFEVGGTVVLTRDPSAESAFRLIAKRKVTMASIVPTLVSLWLEAREFDDTDLSSLETIQVGGAKLPPSLATQVPKMLGARLQQVFGMAEGLLNFTRVDDSNELVETTQGRPLSPDDEIRIVDANGAEVNTGETGELWTRGPYTIRGYSGDPSINNRSFTRDGFYRTGDLVRQLPSGHLVVEGRTGDQINRAGEKFSASEIEEHLIDLSSIRAVAVIGVPDNELGEASCANVEPGTANPTMYEIRGHLRKRGIATYKLPDRLRIVEELPLTRFGKIDRKKLVEQALKDSDSVSDATNSK